MLISLVSTLMSRWVSDSFELVYLYIRSRFRCCHCHHHHYLKISLELCWPRCQICRILSFTAPSPPPASTHCHHYHQHRQTNWQSFHWKGGWRGCMRFIQFLGKRLKNLKLSLRKSRYVFSYQWKSGNAIKQIHISQLTNPTQKTFLGPDYSANVSFLLNSFCQVTFLEWF